MRINRFAVPDIYYKRIAGKIQRIRDGFSLFTVNNSILKNTLGKITIKSPGSLSGKRKSGTREVWGAEKNLYEFQKKC